MSSDANTLKAIKEITNDPAFHGGLFGSLRNSVIGGLAIGASMGVAFYVGSVSATGSNHFYDALSLAALTSMTAGYFLNMYAQGVQRDYLRIIKLRGLDQDLLNLLEHLPQKDPKIIKYKKWIQEENFKHKPMKEKRFASIIGDLAESKEVATNHA